jgi:hypothetical protein
VRKQRFFEEEEEEEELVSLVSVLLARARERERERESERGFDLSLVSGKILLFRVCVVKESGDVIRIIRY